MQRGATVIYKMYTKKGLTKGEKNNKNTQIEA